MVTSRYLSDKFLKPLHEKLREEGRKEGREEVQLRWALGTERRLDAESRKAKPFDEPPPGPDRSRS